MKYFVMIESRDGVQMPTTPEPMDMTHVGEHIELRLSIYRRQGYFSNARQERIPVDSLEFRIVPEAREADEMKPWNHKEWCASLRTRLGACDCTD